MKVTPLELKGLLLIEPVIFTDERGYFFESFNEDRFKKSGIDAAFVQDNHSLSSKGVLRGLHFQKPPFEQGKLVRVAQGAVIDVVVDIRKQSPDYGKSLSMILSANNNHMLWIPPGFAHGFLALENETVFLYKCTKAYNKESESGIIWNDTNLNINWGITSPIVSAKDLELPAFKNLNSGF
ncbi:MAG: dTDP-4-dehydrorhamnose 3,5-epimerase [Bacteroidetes bacterium]|nr:dTDP-4-dehydrorhamnose 3,5-epimerase [Bacteroidota bacterium]MBK7970110.1 dTDP-4-dehydrorhamnose 3,5-epimerase [Bacteroidota bacterium]MBK9048265.1 dTDP-4-dehydrorhamnose 3,5-epimerase [Bacteroidota bacterium]MBK9425375.1 dTDP-4-dehydrorhamnose 3,5-epimerase [Bacteroidota bacterium]MBL0072201.1 dTDP-4-dehydrorhamnose 3,5-epimerase [Bacteroidota bacterium]